MLVLKIHQNGYERTDGEEDGEFARQFDQGDIFIDGVQIIAHDWLEPDKFSNLAENFGEGFYDYADYTFGGGGDYEAERARLISVDGKRYYLASHAWLLGPDGRTIERLA